MTTTHHAKKTGLTQCDRILAALRQRRRRWVDMVLLWKRSGAFAVHSRISDLRKAGHRIEHRNTRAGRAIHSAYRLN